MQSRKINFHKHFKHQLNTVHNVKYQLVSDFKFRDFT